MKDFAVVSDETVYENPRFFHKLERKLAKEQKILSRRAEQAKQDGRKLSRIEKLPETARQSRPDP